jgi:hypothetical protein
MRVAKFSDMAVMCGTSVLLQNFPLLRVDPVRAMRLAEEIAGSMVLEDEGKSIIRTAPDEEVEP